MTKLTFWHSIPPTYPIINEAIEQLVNQWNNHPLSTECNFSPRQLWALGMPDARNPRSSAVHDVLIGHDGIESFGVDEEDGELTGDDNQGIVVPTCPYQMTQEQVEAVQNRLR